MSDAKLVIDAVRGTSDVPWRLLNIIEDVKNIARSFECISWAHAFREANFLVDVGIQYDTFTSAIDPYRLLPVEPII